MLTTVKEISSLGIDALKFDKLQVIKDNRLYKMYQENLVETWYALRPRRGNVGLEVVSWRQ